MVGLWKLPIRDIAAGRVTIIDKFIWEALRDREVRLWGMWLLVVVVSSINPGAGEGDREMELRVAYCVELAVVSKPLGSEYDLVGLTRGGGGFVFRRLGLCDGTTGVARVNGTMRRRG